MVKEKNENTEQKILQAAQNIFIKKGMDGARMQEIADEAQINKALLHYYFRSKQKLFEAIFDNLFKQIFPNFSLLFNKEIHILNRLDIFIENYLEILMQNPGLPAFILKEINRDPEMIVAAFRRQGFQPQLVAKMFEEEMAAGNIRKMNPSDLLISLLSNCIFPLAAQPLLQIMLFDNAPNRYQEFLNNRKETAKEMFRKILAVN